MHKNFNDAFGNFVIYEIIVDGISYKIGKADLDRITQSSGDPTRIHQQVRKLRLRYGKGNVFHNILDSLFGVTTEHAKKVEHEILMLYYLTRDEVPEGNRNSFNPKK